MNIAKNQFKIPHMFRKANRLPDHFGDLQKNIEDLENELKQKKNDYFQLQRESLKSQMPIHKPFLQKTFPFIRPEKIVLSNDLDKMKNDLKLMTMLTGMEVKSYIVGEHCSILFHMQIDSKNVVKHGLRIEMQSGTNVVAKSSLPLGFNIKEVIDDYDNVMMPECLHAILVALACHYNRLDQFEKLKRTFQMEVELFKVLDGTHIEITFTACNDLDTEVGVIELVLVLDYRVYDDRPKQYTFKELDLPEGSLEALKYQCLVFKKKPLKKAFKEAFITGVGPYKLVNSVGLAETEVRKRKAFRPNKHNYKNDDTFHPEDCSGESEDDEMNENLL